MKKGIISMIKKRNNLRKQREEVDNEVIENFDRITQKILTSNDDELHDNLIDIFEENDVPLPWDGDFEEFMSNPNNCLVFD